VGAARTSSRLLLSVLAIIYILIEIQINRFELHSAAYLWIAPAWLVWYLLARASARVPAAVPIAASESNG
jgi:uncharacterized membrane protein (DUF106 family)